jgi:hypothetical protein
MSSPSDGPFSSLATQVRLKREASTEQERALQQETLHKWEQMREAIAKLAGEASAYPQLTKVWGHFYDAQDLLERKIAALKAQDGSPPTC